MALPAWCSSQNATTALTSNERSTGFIAPTSQLLRNSKIRPINVANNATHIAMAMRVAFAACSFSHQVAG